MKDFFRSSLAVVVGIMIYSLVASIFMGLLMLIMVAIGSKDSKVKIADNSILHLELNSPIKDRSTDNFMETFDFMSMDTEEYIGLNTVLKTINKAETDEKIKGIYLQLTSLDAGLAEIEEIRNAIIKFKETGKFVVAYADNYEHKTYYLASVADNIYLTPTGSFMLYGFSSQIMFYKNALEKIGVEPQIIRHGKFKSAVEPFMLEEMSDANREQTETFMFSMWDDYVAKIAQSRNLTPDDINRYADSLEIVSAQSTVDKKLVDALKYYDEVVAELKTLTEVKEKGKLKLVSLSDYSKTFEDELEKLKNKDKKIAIIYALGSIEMGKGDTYTIGAEGMSKAIRKARKDSTVKAIVLRINSPGGSALASEIIWREINLAKQDKPIVVSMGKYAASGGYYIAAPADKIIAQPNTLTGSIGVFGMYPNVQKLMNEKIGINVSTVKTNEHADFGNFTRPLSQKEKDYLQLFVEETYATFIQHVADGRNMTTAQVDSIGQGRVWSGINALEIGLVDELGGLNRAIDVAAELAELENYQIVELPKSKDPFEQIFEEMQIKMENAALKRTLGESYKYYQELNEIMQMQGVQARMPYEIEIN